MYSQQLGKTDSEINILSPRTYTQIHTPTVVHEGGGGVMEPFPKVFDMLQYFMGGGAAGGL